MPDNYSYDEQVAQDDTFLRDCFIRCFIGIQRSHSLKTKLKYDDNNNNNYNLLSLLCAMCAKCLMYYLTNFPPGSLKSI